MAPKELEELKHNCITFSSNYFYATGRKKYRKEKYYFPKVTMQV